MRRTGTGSRYCKVVKRCVFPVVALVLLLLPVTAKSADAAPRPRGKIAFVRDGDVWMMNADGSGQTVVERAPGGSDYRNPKWVLNGRGLLFGEVDIRFGSYVPDGPFRTVIRNLVSGAKSFIEASNAEWSPDGELVASYSLYSTDVAQIATADLKHTWRLSNPQDVRQIIWLNKRKLLLLSGASNLIELFDFNGLERKPTATVIEPQQTLQLPDRVSIKSLALSPSSERVAVTVKLDENNYRLDIYHAADFEFEKSVLTGTNDPDLVNHYLWGTTEWAGNHSIILVDSSNYNYTINGLSILNVETKEHLGGPEGGNGMQIGNPSVSPSGGEVVFDRGDPSVYAGGTPAVYLALNKRGADLHEQKKIADNASQPAWQPKSVGNTPVLLIHGMGQSSENWQKWASDFTLASSAKLKGRRTGRILGEVELLEARSSAFGWRPVYALNYKKYRSAKGNILSTAQSVPWAIDEIKGATGEDKVAIVSHSMGGLLARAYMEGLLPQPYKKDVDSLTTLDTPHMGSSLADDGVLGEAISRLPYLGGGDAAQDMDPDSSFITSVNGGYLPREPAYSFTVGNYYPYFGDGLLTGWEQLPYMNSTGLLHRLRRYEITFAPVVHSETINKNYYKWLLRLSGVNTGGASGEAILVLDSQGIIDQTISKIKEIGQVD